MPEPIHTENTITVDQSAAPTEQLSLGQRALRIIDRLMPVQREPQPAPSRQPSSLRRRLTTAMLLIVLIPTVLSATVSVITGWHSAQQQVVNQLRSVATLKEAQIHLWLNDLHTDLTVLQTEEMQADFITLLGAPVPDKLPEYKRVRSHFARNIAQTGRFEAIFLVDTSGRVILSTSLTQYWKNYRGWAFFEEGLQEPLSHLTWEAGVRWVSIVHPIYDETGRTRGILVGRATMDTINAIMMERSGLGETGETYLVSAEQALLTDIRAGSRPVYVRTQGVQIATQERAKGSGTYPNYRGRTVIGVFHWLPDINAALLAEQEQIEALRPALALLGISTGVALLAITIAILAALTISRSVTDPLTRMAATASQVAAGELEHTVCIKREDEIGVLARTFNSMTAQLRDLIGNLEAQVAQRTQELEQRSNYLAASADVARAASSILDSARLTRQVVELIKERFSLYYVGLFLLDEAGEWAVLRAGTGEAGEAMLRRGHKIKVGEGMIGWSIAHAQSRIALDVGEDAVRLATNELPNTRSEAALPLRARGQIIGALTVQSDQPGAFDENSIAVLQTMADQVAIALENARLFTQNQAALETTQRAYGELSRRGWVELLRTQPDIGYRSSKMGIAPTTESWRADMEQAVQTGSVVQGNGTGDTNRYPLIVPIKVGNTVIGILDTYKPIADGPWNEEEIAILEALADQLGLALEGARLYRDAQQRASREQLTREIADKMRQATSVEEIIQTTVDELFHTLGTSRAFVKLGLLSPADDTDGETHDT